jgi:L-ascorbate metabolism protein UlaG (beta-lactamase superfamily)
MQITKLEHACLVLEQDNQRIILDPGSYTRPVGEYKNVVAVVITHMHDDHCSEAQLDAILESNPEVVIYGTDEVCRRLEKYQTVAVHHGDYFTQGNFTLEFFGDIHAEIHRSIPLIQNCGVMINGKLYYPGDSYTQPDRAVELLACPTSAPWLRIGDVMDFVAAVKPQRTIATHNVHLSDIGHELNNGRVKLVTESVGGKFEYLTPGQTTQL